ncbi:MAG: hypothetical protein H6707_15310 [Deltaproteobacteria bacterium]|nr:hypothetical protein [Deltaproteobacteria bacterium]
MESESTADGAVPDAATVVSAPAQPVAGSTVRQTVGKNGGALALGDLQLDVPTGALGSDVEIVARVTAQPVDPKYILASLIYAFEPAGTRFAKPVTLRIPIFSTSSDLVVVGSRADDPSQFEALPTRIEGGFALTEVEHFSRFFTVPKCVLDGSCLCKTDNDCAALDDTNLCNGTVYCDSKTGLCLQNYATVISCPPDDSNPCSEYVCDPLKGECVYRDKQTGSACDDGNPCTTETCAGGKCKATKNLCSCQTDDDCAGQEDGNLCNGTLFCDRSKVPYECAVNPATIVKCAETDKACMENRCDPQTGKCVLQAGNEFASCQDLDPDCTFSDFCKDGACQSGLDQCRCHENADCKDPDDNLCNGSEYWCNKKELLHKCELLPASIVTCDHLSPEGACMTDYSCNPKTGKCENGPVADGKACDDGFQCTVNDVCSAGKCVGSASVGKANPKCECQTDADCVPFEDGNLCNGTLFCDKAANKCLINTATVVKCDPGSNTACAESSCDPKDGLCKMKAVNELGSCDDGNACTNYDKCLAGQCVGTDICECYSKADCAAKEDGNPCTGTLICDNTKVPHRCLTDPTTVPFCSADNDTDCVKNKCNPADGKCQMVNLQDGTSCDDQNPCTSADSCKSGSCNAGPKVCQCENNADCAALEDGDLCNGTLYCDKASFPYVCKVNPATIVSCSTANDSTCSKNTCAPSSGSCAMTAVNEGGSCDDGDSCTTNDSCKSGSCQGTGTCDQCQLDSDCAPFEDGNKCNGTLYCQLWPTPKACVVNPTTIVSCPTPAWPDCQSITCNPGTGQCDYVDQPTGTPCDLDNDPCTADTCTAGVCMGGPNGC